MVDDPAGLAHQRAFDTVRLADAHRGAHAGQRLDAFLKIAADGNLKQQYIMAAYDAAKKAGFSKIHFVPPPVLSSKLKVDR